MNAVVGIAIAAVATAITAFLIQSIAAQAGTAQPWSQELSDNFVFARAMPLLLGLGVLYGVLGGWPRSSRAAARRADGAVRRFSRTTVALHALLAVGFVLALPTGVWQYLGGILDNEGPFEVYQYYRIHYIGAAIILVVVTAFLSYWWMTGDRSLLVPRGDLSRHLRGFALEIPRPLGTRLAGVLKLDLRQPAGTSGTFSFYEKVFSFPTWGFGVALITITGIVKLLRYVVPIPGPVLFVDSTLHVTAMVILLIRTLDHLRYTFGRWPLMVAMTTGWLPQRRGSMAGRTAESVSAKSSATGAGS